MLGRPAPDFTLVSNTGESVKLSDQRGHYVVLVFYPANNTPVCNLQLAEMNDDLASFADSDILVFGINPAAASSHESYCQKKGIQFPVLSDPGCGVSRSYDAAFPILPLIKRTVVAVDPSGTICYYQRGKPEPELVRRAIEAHRNR